MGQRFYLLETLRVSIPGVDVWQDAVPGGAGIDVESRHRASTSSNDPPRQTACWRRGKQRRGDVLRIWRARRLGAGG